jgi:hypothetical protein
MQMKAVGFRLGTAAAIVLSVALGMQSGVSAGQNPPAGGGQGGGRGGGRGFSLPPLLMETDAFPDGGIVPQKYTGRGGVQPGFKFSNAPAGTVAYAIIFHDIDVALQGGTGDVLHWIAWNIPASANGIPEGSLPAGSVQGNNLTGSRSTWARVHPPVRAITTTCSSSTRSTQTSICRPRPRAPTCSRRWRARRSRRRPTWAVPSGKRRQVRVPGLKTAL